MTDWFSELNGAAPAGTEAPQQRDWFSEINGGGIMQTAAPKPQAKPQQGWGEWAAELPLRGYKAVVGTHDPAYKDLKAFDDTPAAGDTGYKTRATAGLIGNADDKAYGDIIQKSLGANFIRRFKDANGYDIIEHKGPDGQPTRAYVNKPGLDIQDVGRGVVGALPYVIGGSAMAGLKGARTLPGVVAQSGLAGATSLAGDALSAGAGAELPSNMVGKAGVTAVGAGVGAVVSPLVGAMWQRFVTIPGLVDANGKLTAKGLAAAKAAGIDDASALEGKIAQEFAATYAKTGDAAASALKAESGAYGVETTLGQRTKDPMQILREKGYRMGNYGDAAKQSITELDARQADQIERMVRGTGANTTGATKVEPGMLERIAPNKPYVSTNPAALGEEIQSGVRSAKGAAEAEARAVWKDVPDLVPKKEAFADLEPHIVDSLTRAGGGKQFRITTDTPQAMKMNEALANYANGEPVAVGAGLVKQAPIETVNDMRLHLKTMMFNVDPNHKADRAAAKAVYDGYNEWIKASAKNALLEGDVSKAANLFKGVDLTKEMHSIFRPTDQNFKPNAATRIMESILNDPTPERIVSALFSNPTKTLPKDGAVQVLQRLKQGLPRYTPQTADEAWNTIRAAHWSKLIEDSSGKLLSYPVMAKNINSAIRSHSSLMNVIYTQPEMREMLRISRVLEGASWKDPNPSGTGTAVQGIFGEFFKSLFRALPIGNTAKIAAEFSGLPNRVRNAAGYVGANNAVSQGLRTTTDPALSGVGGAGANALYGQ